jgi:hypothetical protein
MSAKSQSRRLARKYPGKPRIFSAPFLELSAVLYDGPCFEPSVTVELLDENDPEGMVVFKNKEGRPTVWMPRPVYDYFVNLKIDF